MYYFTRFMLIPEILGFHMCSASINRNSMVFYPLWFNLTNRKKCLWKYSKYLYFQLFTCTVLFLVSESSDFLWTIPHHLAIYQLQTLQAERWVFESQPRRTYVVKIVTVTAPLPNAECDGSSEMTIINGCPVSQ